MRLFLAFALLLLAWPPALARQLPQNGLPKGFVYLDDLAPQIAQDIRYAGVRNFTGDVLSGYAAEECILRREVAQALAQVAKDLAPQHLGLKVYDCYRPERAVRAMWRWAHDGKRDGDKHFYPNVDKRELFTLGYIAARSRHSTGAAVDVTLVPRPAPRPVMDRPSPGGPCTASPAQRAFDNSLDMGTGFDCLDVKSYTGSSAVTPEQRRARDTLKAAMAAHGFRNYFREWWHYEFTGASGLPARDFPIEPR